MDLFAEYCIKHAKHLAYHSLKNDNSYTEEHKQGCTAMLLTHQKPPRNNDAGPNKLPVIKKK